MPIAERSDLVATINEFVISGVIRQAADWAEKAGAPGRIGVNLSHAQLMAGNVVDLMQKYLAHHGVAADRLQVEVRESDLVNKSREVFDVIHQLKGLGVRFAIDQFGRGAFSVALLEELPLDAVKIERARVNGPGRDIRSDAISSGIVAIVRRLDMSVTAVGIESDADIRRLRNWGCDQFQGNLFSGPVPAAELTDAVVPGISERFRLAATAQATDSGVFSLDLRPESRPLRT
jgi:EAL domain-containing protein (putative c-di-GMP-specific phosphodiesterase class I)